MTSLIQLCFCLASILTLARSQNFIFPDDDLLSDSPNANECVPISKCPSLMRILTTNRNGLSEFDRCGFDDNNTPMFKCPDLARVGQGPRCDCKKLTSCHDLHVLALKKDIEALNKHTRCGFEDRIPKYCCPSKQTNSTTKTKKVSTAGSGDDNIETVVRTSVDSSEKSDLQCGFVNSLKITQGDDAAEHEFPWAVALIYVRTDMDGNEEKMNLCGGTLVSDQYVVTAAHCIDSKRGFQLREVRMGHANLTHEKTFSVLIEFVRVHPDFESEPFLVNDIALLKLSEKVEIKSNVMPICLPTEDSEKNAIAPEVIGWGLVNLVETSDWLQKLTVNITTNIECEDAYLQRIAGFFLEDSQMCAYGSKRGSDSCKGDSGGPLMYHGLEQSFLLGITSFGTVMCDSSVPGVYTRVSSYVDWIENIVFN